MENTIWFVVKILTQNGESEISTTEHTSQNDAYKEYYLILSDNITSNDITTAVYIIGNIGGLIDGMVQ